MKPKSVLAAAALLVLIAACSKKEETNASETNTTSAPIQNDRELNRPVAVTGGTVTNGTSTELDNNNERTVGLAKGRDAGSIVGDTPAVPSDLQTSQPNESIVHEPTSQPNHSTTLGDGKSGQYTGGKGTYGGKATQGTGPKH